MKTLRHFINAVLAVVNQVERHFDHRSPLCIDLTAHQVSLVGVALPCTQPSVFASQVLYLAGMVVSLARRYFIL
ncbi:hypothetical protein [Vibrio sp. SCSIO 43136]|uniref:hypothetical protein n=1 Tax=Vibrio sp. SCSIO 43136 TaxID=2819101 RepID=UPI002075B5E1|nr:hypothetical protein [Vibrio sp. SCSIO 43136]USD67994.1 hypothetical protein J4N39_17605 [Vibrio sp. SCSIO 43136]